MGQIMSLVAPVTGVNFVDALVFGSRQKALAIAAQVPANELPRVLGLLRYHLRMFGALRALGAGAAPERELLARAGLDAWRWRTKYKPHFQFFTDERIRLRLIEVSRARAAHESGAEAGVLEVLALRW
jgi:hypothetical protein